jgi:N-hydroxyarylamine O-acetyltransferase
MIDLDAYFERIGYDGARKPTLDTMRALHRLQPQAIAFENLDPLLGRPVRLDAPSLEQKLVHGGRGGYCFEQNLLFAHALRAIGFKVTELAARVLWNVPAGVSTPREHMLLLTEIGGQRFLTDVGFGGNVLTAPLLLDSSDEQATPHEPFQVLKDGDRYLVQFNLRGEWVKLYRFDLSEQLLPDHEQGNWFVSTHPLRFSSTAYWRRAPSRTAAMRCTTTCYRCIGAMPAAKSARSAPPSCATR